MSSPSCVVNHDLCTHYLAKLGEHLNELLVCEIISEVLDVYVGEMLVVAKVPEPLFTADELSHIPNELFIHIMMSKLTGNVSQYKAGHTTTRQTCC